MEPLLTTSKGMWTQPQKILAMLIVLSVLLNLGTLTVVAIVGARIFDVTSSESLCRTATTCLGKANLQFTDAIVAGLDPTAWNRVFGDIAQLAKQLKVVNWTFYAAENCRFVVRCNDLSSVDCSDFIGDKGGKCEWNAGNYLCQTPSSQTFETSMVTGEYVMGCRHFLDSTSCQNAEPVEPTEGCEWDVRSFCTDKNPANPARVTVQCREEFSIDNATQQDINNEISKAQSVAESYRTNATRTGVDSSLDITQYIARQLESNWTLTASTCMSLTQSLFYADISPLVCPDNIRLDCDAAAQWRVAVRTVNMLCEKVKAAHLSVNQSG